MTRNVPKITDPSAEDKEALTDLVKPATGSDVQNPSPSPENLEEPSQTSQVDGEAARENLGGVAADLLEETGKELVSNGQTDGYDLPGLFFDINDLALIKREPAKVAPAGDVSGVPATVKPSDQLKTGESFVSAEVPPSGDGKTDSKPGEAKTDTKPGDAKPGDVKPPEAQPRGDKQPDTNDKSAALKLKEFDANFDALLKRLGKEIDTEKLGVDMMSDELRKARTESMELRIKSGWSEANQEQATEKGEKEKADNYGKQLAELRKLDKTSVAAERKIFEHLPEAINARTMKAIVQISSGKDEHVHKGEVELCRLVKDNPKLATSKEFRQAVLLAYTEMAAARQIRGLGEWQTKVKVDDIVSAKPDGSEKSDPIKLLQKANETFFQDDGGIEKASPFFKQAIAAQKAIDIASDRNRLDLFIQSISQDTKVTQDALAGKDVDQMIEKRIAHGKLEEKAVEEALSAKETESSLRVNFAFARIATGQPGLYDEAVKDLMASLRDNPAMSLDEGFQNNSRQAFKAHAQNRKAIDEAAAKGQKEEDAKPVYNDLDLKKIVKNNGGKQDAKVESYTADDLTGPLLTALGLGIALAQFARTRAKYHAASIMKEGLSAASEVKGIEGLAPDVRAERQARSGETAKFEIKGTARDGRLVLLKEGKPSETPPTDLKEVKPGKAFSPERMQYGEFVPVSVDGKQYFADKDGRAYKYEHKTFSEPRLFEDSETRQVELVPRRELQSLLPEVKVDPDALKMTNEHPQKAMPKEWQMEFDFIRDVKRAVAENDRHVSSRMETLDRAVKGLNDVTYGDRLKYLQELSRQMEKVGIKVDYVDLPGEDARNLKVYLSEPGSDRRLVISGEYGKPVAMEMHDKEGKFTKSEAGVVKVADQLSNLEKTVTSRLKDVTVKDKFLAHDPELHSDASRKEVRRSFLDGLSGEWRSARDLTLRFQDAIRRPANGNLRESISTMMTEVAKAPPEVMTRVLTQMERELKSMGIQATADVWQPADASAPRKATLSILAPDGKTKLIFFSDGSKPGLEPNSIYLPGVVVHDDVAFNKAMADVSKKVESVVAGKPADTTGGEKAPTPGAEGDPGERQSSRTTERYEGRTGPVPHYESLPLRADREVSEFNRRVSEVFKGVSKEQFKKMDPIEKQKLIDKAVEQIVPLMEQYAERLGLPKNLVNKNNITFDALDKSLGTYLMTKDRIVLDMGLTMPADVAFHELVHKMRALDLQAAFKADPTGARLALLDSMLSDRNARIRVGSNIVDRPRFADPKVAAEFRQLVEYHALKRLKNEGRIDASQVPPEKPPSAALLKAFGSMPANMYDGSTNLYNAVADEIANFRDTLDLIEKKSAGLTAESRDYVAKKAGDYRQWLENPRGTAVVRLAVHEVMTGLAGKGTAAEQIKAVQERVALLTAEKNGDATTGIQVHEDLVKKVMESYGKNDPKVETLIAKGNAEKFKTEGAARAEFDSTPRSLRDNPYVEKLLSTASIDRVGALKDGKIEYAFASEEISARKGDVAERARRLYKELKPDSPEQKRIFGEFVEYLRMASEQQRLNKAMASDNMTEARAIALTLQDKFASNVDFNKTYVDFLLMNGLIQPHELNEAFKDFHQVGGRARAIAMDRFARGRSGDFVQRVVPGESYTDYILKDPIKLYSDSKSPMKVESIRVYKDGTMTIDYIDGENRRGSDPIAHHWPGEIDPPGETEFEKDFKKIEGKREGNPAEKKVALIVDYLKQIETQEIVVTGKKAEGNANARRAPEGAVRNEWTVEPGVKPGPKPGTRGGGAVERPATIEKPGAEKPKAETKLDTTRIVTDHSGKDSATLVADSLTLTTLYNEGKNQSELGRTGLDKQFDRFRNNSRMMLDKLASTSEGKAQQLNDLLRKFTSQVDSLKDNPLLTNAKVVADKSLSSGGKLVFTHGEIAIEPLYTDATRVHFKAATGEIKSAPLGEVKVEMRVSEAALNDARMTNSTTNSKLKAAEIVSTLFHQLHQVDQLRGRQERAKMNGIDLASTTGDAVARKQFLEREKAHADVAAEYLQFNLNGNSLDGREPIHATPPVAYDIKKPIAELMGERIVTSMGSDGRMKIFVLNKNKTVTELESERSEALIKDGFKKMVERCNEKIKEAEKANNKELVEKYKAERERILKDQHSYETDPAFKKNVHHEVAKHSKARARLGAAVTVMFLVTYTLDHMRRESHGSDLNLDIDITGT